jgi:hypothetical protein
MQSRARARAYAHAHVRVHTHAYALSHARAHAHTLAHSHKCVVVQLITSYLILFANTLASCVADHLCAARRAACTDTRRTPPAGRTWTRGRGARRQRWHVHHIVFVGLVSIIFAHLLFCKHTRPCSTLFYHVLLSVHHIVFVGLVSIIFAHLPPFVNASTHCGNVFDEQFSCFPPMVLSF